jgi:hypothetical protein
MLNKLGNEINLFQLKYIGAQNIKYSGTYTNLGIVIKFERSSRSTLYFAVDAIFPLLIKRSGRDNG